MRIRTILLSSEQRLACGPGFFAPIDHRRSQTPLLVRSSLWNLFLCWETKMKIRSAARGIFDFNCSTMGFDDRAHNSQTHPEAIFLCGEEMFEEPVARYLCNSATVIAHSNGDHAVPIGICRNLDDSSTRGR